MTLLAAIVVCTALVNILWLSTLVKWPQFPVEYTIMLTIIFSSLSTVMACWMLVAP